MKNKELVISDAIKRGKWLDISYKNSNNEITYFWIAIKDIDLKGKKLKKNLSYANNNNINNVIMIGQSEVEENNVTLKDMDSGEQVTISLSEAIEKLSN